MMNAAIVRQAIKRAECFEIDYSGMTDDEIYELDHAIDTIFKAAKEHAEMLEKYTEIKVIGNANLQ